MSTPPVAASPPAKMRELGGLRSQMRRIRRLGFVGMAAGVIVCGAVLVAVFAPLLAPLDPNTTDLSAPNMGPTPEHLLGTDALGRDLLSRLIWGSRTALLGPLLVILMAGAIGTAIALVAAWNEGWVDTVLSRSLDVLFAIPGILLALLAVATFGTGLVPAAVGLAIAYLPYIARVTRASALRERHLTYIAASMVQGQSTGMIIGRHLLPNVFPVVLAQATVLFGYAMVDLSAISFLGLGVQPPASDWGLMVQEGQEQVLEGYPEQAIYAGMAIVVVVVAFNLLGERLLALAEDRPG